MVADYSLDMLSLKNLLWVPVREGIEEAAAVEALVLRRPIEERAVKRQEHPLPLGRESQRLSVEFAQALLDDSYEFTPNAAAFLYRVVRAQEGFEKTFSEIRSIAEQEYFERNPGAFSFPVIEFTDFLSSAYRFGLLQHRFESPNGDPLNRERVVRLNVSGSEALRLIQERVGDLRENDATEGAPGRAADVIPLEKSDRESRVAKAGFSKDEVEIVNAIIDYLHGKGEVMVDDACEEIGERIAPLAGEFYDRFHSVINRGSRVGLFLVREDDLGARVLSAA